MRKQNKSNIIGIKQVASPPIIFRITCLLLLLTTFANLSAQVAVSASGGKASGSGGSESFTVGQVVYTTVAGTGGSQSQGIQLPYEIFEITGVEEKDGIILYVSAYPNPTSGILVLKVEDYQTRTLQCKLLDLDGKVLETITLAGAETRINLSNYASATYFLHLTDKGAHLKTFKIIKN